MMNDTAGITSSYIIVT